MSKQALSLCVADLLLFCSMEQQVIWGRTYGNAVEFDTMRHPRAILMHAIPSQLREDLLTTMMMSLCKYLSAVHELLDCLSTLMRRSADRKRINDSLIASREFLPDVVQEYARQVAIVLDSPELFPGMFGANQAFFGFGYGMIGVGQRASFPFEELDVLRLEEEHAASPLFDIGVREIQLRALDWLLNRGTGHWFGQAPHAPSWPFLKLMRRLMELLIRSGARSPSEWAVDLALSTNVMRNLNMFPGPVLHEVKEFIRQCLRHSDVQSADLDKAVRKLVLQNRHSIRAETVEMLRLLFSCGASTLLRDDAGFLLITNIRAGVIYANDTEDLRVRHYYHWMPHRFESSQRQRDIGEKLSFASTDVHRDAVDLITSFGANWTRQTHALFPKEFRNRIFAFLCVNRRQRSEKMPWLPRDPLQVIIKLVATSDFCDEDQQLEETKTLLAHTYESISERELLSMCKDVDVLAGGRKPRGHVRGPYRAALRSGTYKKPFKSFCEERNLNPRRRQGLERDVLISFLVSNELGLLE